MSNGSINPFETPESLLPQREPLGVFLSSSGRDRIEAGRFFQLRVTVANQLEEGVSLDLWIDALTPPLQEWCREPIQHLSLAGDRSGEVVFEFAIPVNAMASQYDYSVYIEKSQPDARSTPFRKELTLQVAEPVRAAEQLARPTFRVQPVTRADNPAELLPGELLFLQVTVQNRSPRVDRLRLICKDWPAAWVEIDYPEEPAGLGTLVPASNLPLNPGERGLISVTLKPPNNKDKQEIARAGGYVPTLQLISENNPDLSLLELVYLTVLPIYDVQVNFRPLQTMVRTGPARYQVQCSNEGNSDREIILRAVSLEEDAACKFFWDRDRLLLPPQQRGTAILEAIPHPPKKQPWRGGRSINFSIELEDADNRPLPIQVFPGNLLWLPRPWWQFGLVVGQVAVAILLLIAVAIWLLVRSRAVPAIATFAATDTQYAVTSGDAVHLNWRIRRPHLLKSLVVVGRSPQGEVLSNPRTYAIENGIPVGLENLCSGTRQFLDCRNVPTDARLAANYQFELSLIPQRSREQPLPKLQTELVSVLPPPTAIAFAATQPSYTVAVEATEPEAAIAGTAVPAPAEASEPGPIALDWTIDNAAQLQQVSIVPLDAAGKALANLGQTFSLVGGLPAELQDVCTLNGMLICQGVPTLPSAVGQYSFQLSLSPSGTPTSQAAPHQIGPIAIEPALSIDVFTVDGQTAPQIDAIAGQTLPLVWKVAGGAGTVVQLLPVPGNVPLQGEEQLQVGDSSLTVTLQATDSAGNSWVKAVAIAVAPSTPAAAVAIPPADPTDSLNQSVSSGESGGRLLPRTSTPVIQD
ncbi:hypothetical protein [Synechococcus sp. PCC 7336]|uniref:hypothetical protein n=1 Tax=Synechococcus sp. PCC 7336 TaxID=195250 RepID=UPI000349790B|nr:hypothetical protein [Synechococcus sp. PCC 7336]